MYTTSTFPIMHLICPPKFCISIVFNLFWDGYNTQEKWKTKVKQNLGGKYGALWEMWKWRIHRFTVYALFYHYNTILSPGLRRVGTCASVLITGLGKTLKDEADDHHHHLLLLESTYSTCHHNYNKIIKSDWLSTVLISALIGQFNRTVGVMPK